MRVFDRIDSQQISGPKQPIYAVRSWVNNKGNKCSGLGHCRVKFPLALGRIFLCLNSLVSMIRNVVKRYWGIPGLPFRKRCAPVHHSITMSIKGRQFTALNYQAQSLWYSVSILKILLFKLEFIRSWSLIISSMHNSTNSCLIDIYVLVSKYNSKLNTKIISNWWK